MGDEKNVAGDELERFSFWLRYPSKGRKPMGEGTVRTYLYTVRRFHRFRQVNLRARHRITIST